MEDDNIDIIDFIREIMIAVKQKGNSIKFVEDGIILNLKIADKIRDGVYQGGNFIVNGNKIYMSNKILISRFRSAEKEAFRSMLNCEIKDEQSISRIIEDLNIYSSNFLKGNENDEYKKFLEDSKNKIRSEKSEGKSDYQNYLVKAIHNYFNEYDERQFKLNPDKAVSDFIEMGILTPEQILDFSNLNKEIPIYKKINIKKIFYAVKSTIGLEKYSFAHAIGDKAYKENILTSKIKQNYLDDPFLYDLMRDGEGFKILLDIYTNLHNFRNGRLTYEDFKKAKISNKWVIDNVDVPTIKEFIYCGLGKKFGFDSKKIVDIYGTKLSGKDLLEIAKKGFVSPEKLIDAGIYKNVQITNPEKAIDIQELIDFYTPDRILEMYKNGNLSNNFIKKFNKIINDNNVEFNYTKFIEETKNLVKNLDKEESKKGSEKNQGCHNEKNSQLDYSNALQYYLDNKLIPAEYTKQVYSNTVIVNKYKNGEISTDELLGIYSPDQLKKIITEKEIEEIYVENGTISSEDVCKLYNNGIVSRLELSDLLTNEELLQYVNDGKLKEDTLLIPNAKEQISFLEKAYIDDETLNEKTLAKLYLNYPHTKDSKEENAPVCYINAKELRDITDLREFKNDIKTYIDENYRVENLADLLLTRVISISDIKDLEDRGIIKEKDSKKLIDDVIDVAALKNSAINGTFYLSEQNSTGYLKDKRIANVNRKVINNSKKCLTDYDTESEAIETLFKVSGKKDDNDIIPIISETSDGKAGTLTGYNMYISEPYKVAILDKKEPNNACYVMPTSLAFYFFGRNKDGEEIMKTGRNKTSIRNIEGNRFVITLNHSKNFMKNLIKAVGTFNNEAKEDLASDPRCKEYEEFMQKYYEEEKRTKANE